MAERLWRFCFEAQIYPLIPAKAGIQSLTCWR